MNETMASEVIRRANNITAELDDMVRLAMESGMDAEEFHQFRRTVGGVMGEIYLELLLPIFKNFPHLTPAELVPPKS